MKKSHTFAPCLLLTVASTVKGVVKKLEKVDLLGIDEDLNGRLFETFLNATMRGEALGQYFTPRSIVKLGVHLADLKIEKGHIDKILDASCGSGGFLIEALTVMRNTVRENDFLTHDQKNEMIDTLANECIYGIDAAADPNLAKIARINMYLHGDGGSHIYFADGLDKQVAVDKSDSRLIQKETADLIQNVKDECFDVVLTNPPFSMWYEMENELQSRILKQYDLIYEKQKIVRNRLRGSAMFLERYRDLLKSGGKLITVIDETVLSSEDYSYVRRFIRKHFIVRAVISLHGDAFRMAKARVKTALLYLEKKSRPSDTQNVVFMYPSLYLGVDDMPVTTNPTIVRQARKKAQDEINDIIAEFAKFKSGKPCDYVIDAERISDRLDVKYCRPLLGRFLYKWNQKGYDTAPLSKYLILREEVIQPSKDFPDDNFKILSISYEGRCFISEERFGHDINFPKMQIARKGDIVISQYNAYHGAIGFVTEEFDGTLASGSYIVVKCEDLDDSLYLWSIMRSTEIRADFLTSAIGMGRQTISWDDLKNVEVPIAPKKQRSEIAKKIIEAWDLEKKAHDLLLGTKKLLHQKFDVESKESLERFMSTKPPR